MKDELELLLDESKIALKKDREGDYLLFDCSPLLTKLSHFHGGKQALTVFFKGKEFLADPGCCSYDDEDFSLYFKQSHSHSSLLVDGHGDSVLQGLYTWLSAPVCRISPWRDGVISSVMTSDAPGWAGVEWNRTVAFRSGRLEITDQITSDSGHEYTFLFALGCGVEYRVEGKKALLTESGVHVEALFDHPAEVLDGSVCSTYMAFHVKRYIRSVPDFLAGGREIAEKLHLSGGQPGCLNPLAISRRESLPVIRAQRQFKNCRHAEKCLQQRFPEVSSDFLSKRYRGMNLKCR